MADTMNHIERCVAALTDKPVDRLSVYPLAMGVARRCVGDGKMTYREWASDPKKFAQGFIAGQKYFDHDWAIGLMDLSVMAGDLGAHVRMDEQNTPFVDQTVINNPEDYEKLQIPDIKKGRSHVLVEGTGMFVEALGKEVITAALPGRTAAGAHPVRRRRARLHGHGAQQERRAPRLGPHHRVRRGDGQGLRRAQRQARRFRVGLPLGQLLLSGRQGVRGVRGQQHKYAVQAEQAGGGQRHGELHPQLRRPAPPGHPDQGLQAGHLLHGLLPADPGKPQPQGDHRQRLRGQLPWWPGRSTPSSSCAAPSRRWRPPP